MVDFPVVPRKLALLNVDLQNVFVEGSPIAAPDGLAVVDRVNQLSAACRRPACSSSTPRTSPVPMAPTLA
jgi:hypothetical protein